VRAAADLSFAAKMGIMSVVVLSGLQFALWLALIVLGVLLLWRRRWIGTVYAIVGAVAVAAQLALSLVPVGIGEPLIRIPPLGLYGALAAATAVIALVLFVRRALRFTWLPLRGPAIAGALLAPLLAGAALWGLAVLSTPERERERDASRRSITLPPGFRAEVYADKSMVALADGALDNPTVMTFGDGVLFIGDIDGNIWIGRDADKDNRIDSLRKYAEGYQLLVGLVWRGGELFVASSGRVEALRDKDGDGRVDERRALAENLPSLILQPHSNNSLTFGPDGRLYFGVGGTVLSGPEPQPLAASILSVSPDGGDVRVFARGFGNTFEVAFNSAGAMFAGDNENGEAPDEFNHIVEGGDYSRTDQENDPLGISGGAGAPIATFPAHSTPTGMTIYTGAAFPRAYHDTAFVALWSKGDVMNMELIPDKNGAYRANPTVFGSGFLYPIDVVVGPDQALYIADFGTSVVYRVSYVP
jgi:glucose/arabinose dehydrogenase